MVAEVRQWPGADRRTDAGPIRPGAREATRLRGLLLLAGSVRPSDLSRAIDRSLLDLPVEPGYSLLAAWRDHAAALAGALGLPRLPVRVIIDRAGREPTVPEAAEGVPLTVERDAAEYRGTGGVLRDAAAAYEPDDLLLIANGAQILFQSPEEQVRAMLRDEAHVNLTAHADGTPVGLMLVACAALGGIPRIGFVDFKEQVLPRLTERHEVRVVRRQHPVGHPVRTLDGYLAGLRAWHRRRRGCSALAGPFDEDWVGTFSVIEPGARVDPTARVHDSVVLAGGRVEAGAVVVRSLVCPGAVVRAGRIVADRLVAGAAERIGRRSA